MAVSAFEESFEKWSAISYGSGCDCHRLIELTVFDLKIMIFHYFLVDFRCGNSKFYSENQDNEK